MANKRKPDEIEDDPAAEERFMRGIRKALSTPPRKHADEPTQAKLATQP